MALRRSRQLVLQESRRLTSKLHDGQQLLRSHRLHTEARAKAALEVLTQLGQQQEHAGVAQEAQLGRFKRTLAQLKSAATTAEDSQAKLNKLAVVLQSMM